MNKIEMIGLFTALKRLCETGDMDGIKKVVEAVLNEAAPPLNPVNISDFTATVPTPVLVPGSVTAETVVSALNTLNTEEVKSPMVGVFYSAPSPEADSFVRIGNTVKKGDVLCILEAMKSMNEIQAERDGKIIDICANNGDVVEFGQVLFKLDVS